MHRIAPILAVAALGLLVMPVPAEAQWTFGRSTRVRVGDGIPDRPGGFTYCRLAYRSIRSLPSGGGWTTDFPEAYRNLMIRLSELTPTTIAWWSHGEPGFVPVRPTDPELYRCPFVMATHVGELGFNPEEAAAMRDYLLKGGFLWADDFWGSASWRYFAAELQKVFPEHEIVELSPDHPLFSIVYNVPEVPQIPNIGFWRRSGGQTSELGADSARPSLSAVMDVDGRIMVLITHNTDISDGWEREAYDPRFFALFSPDAYAIGINIVIWMMTR
jgi:hypothetical protein